MCAVFDARGGGSNAGSRCYATTETAAQTDELASWIQANGGQVQDVVVARDELQGQTLKSGRHIKKGQTLIALPRDCQLHAYSSDPALQQLIDRIPAALWPARLALPVSSVMPLAVRSPVKASDATGLIACNSAIVIATLQIAA